MVQLTIRGFFEFEISILSPIHANYFINIVVQG